jgi:RNA polymerase sigma factor (sigma-70 family)
MQDLAKIIIDCKKQDATAQKQLYSMYKDILFPICLRYIKNNHEAEDVFIEGFYKIFSCIDQYQNAGSFEGWMKRIMVNEALQFIRKKSKIIVPIDKNEHLISDPPEEDDWYAPYSIEDIMKAVHELPDGYRTIFNLYVFEEFKHREIAEMLNISINTSKSQYLLAKKRLIETLSKIKLLKS